MGKLLDKFYKFIDRIGKQNFMLIVFITFVLVITGLYSTFSLYTSTEDLGIVDGVETFKFVVNGNNNDSSVTIPSKSEKNVAITINNSEDVRLKFGIFYNSTYDLNDVSLGYLETSDYKAVDIIDGGSDGIVTIKIYNDSLDDVMVSFGLSYGLENGGELKKADSAKWVEELEFERFNLNEAPIGSYISYTGTNGCVDDTCVGKNINYVDDNNFGYCQNDFERYKTTGWRIAYVKDLSPYVISAGSPECVDLVANQDENKLNNIALEYCNSKFIYGGNCSDINVWNMNINDFKSMTSNNLYYNTISDNSCFESKENKSCGFENDLIDNGGRYYINDESGVLALSYGWNPVEQFITYINTDESFGIRPILRFDTNIEVIGGKGTMNEPYVIRNKDIYDE